ncbi:MULTISPECIES: hypothetical protein [unclassified Bacillus (in: firmicutes)]|uniref:hypothetical protein n=1 Tax=unclassified Bacillus (in: firmicutes) TaxID=185979 RepID=UPI001BE93D5E|nr:MULTISPECIES: hypothetical protein [unclassified Bacillus (in: firmicutes)]MBT2616132.1 hypothetical protein [Bacillus sp. ISL-78]MBT2628418.1 hypothetical protein [Bacillus sp. ISL-101]
MEKFISFISTSQFNATLAIFSVLLTIAIFFIQEARQKKHSTKETIRLTEELVNLIIRNSVNKSLNISNINLTYMLEGMMFSKNFNLRHNTEQILKMVYAKVYENEHISVDIRPSLLSEIEDRINGLMYEEVDLPNNSNKRSLWSLSISIVTAVVVSFIPSWIIGYVEPSKGTLSNTLLLLSVLVFIIVVPLLIIKVVQPIVRNNKIAKQNSTLTNSSQINIHTVPTIINNTHGSPAPEKEIEFNSFVEDAPTVLEVFKQRFILENLISELLRKTDKDFQNNFSPIKTLMFLRDNNTIDKDFYQNLRELLRFSNSVVHDGTSQHMKSNYIKEIINSMKLAAVNLKELIDSTSSDDDIKTA